ncbi:MAG: hypothetical protein ACXITR_13435 [Cyanobacterium sp.]
MKSLFDFIPEPTSDKQTSPWAIALSATFSPSPTRIALSFVSVNNSSEYLCLRVCSFS